MGTKIAPAFANLFIGDLEQKILAQFPLKPLVWWHYIDGLYDMAPLGRKAQRVRQPSYVFS